MKEVDKNEWRWKKLMFIILLAMTFSICFVCYYKGNLSCSSALLLALALSIINTGMFYLDYYDENVYWDDKSQKGYLFHRTFDINKKKDSFILIAKPACRWVVWCLFITIFAFLSFDIWCRFQGIKTPFLSIAVCLNMLSILIVPRYSEGRRNINFDKKLNKFWKGGKADSVWDLVKYSDVIGLEKIKDFSITHNDGYYDLEMRLDDSKKIKLISNVDEEYLKKIERELREFLFSSK